MPDNDDCGHFGGSFTDHENVKRCITCDAPINDHELGEFEK